MSLEQTELVKISVDRSFDSGYGLLFWPNPMLRLPAIHSFMEFNILLWTRMLPTLLVLNALGINSIQVGWPEGLMMSRMFDTITRMRLFTMVGEVTPHGDANINFEECLSLPGLEQEVTRREYAIIVGYTLDGSLCAINAPYPASICWQHEGDHSAGVLNLDVMIKRLPPVRKQRPVVKLLPPPSHVK
ncbi:MAG: peptide deformylase [Candidatus Hodgkinia cicadicola]